LAVGCAWAALAEWRVQASTTQPTGVTSGAYVSHGRTYFAPAGVARWHDRLAAAYVMILVAFAALTVVAWVATFRSDAVGRRWTSAPDVAGEP
jgi:hypothetical protein